MSEPVEERLRVLRAHARVDKKYGADDEAYHIEFDRLLEERLDQLDPEWMEAMRKEYDSSGAGRWCA